jgi:predicted ATPase
VPRGIYLWGRVGSGKSLLMDSFYATVAIGRKTRVHFHAFMRDVHRALAALARETDPLAACRGADREPVSARLPRRVSRQRQSPTR